MRIATLTWLRNEGDIIESFVRYHCRFVDRMLLIDNGSADDTFDILKRLAAEGLPIECSQQPSLTHTQSIVLTHEMQRILTDASADWILPLDADEFFVASEHKDPRDMLATLPQSDIRMIRWKSYVPTEQDDLREAHPLRRIVHRKGAEDPQWYKVLIPAAALRDANAAVSLCSGNHWVQGANCPHVFEPQVSLAHFPVRDPTQISIKVIGHWLRYASSPKRTPGTIFQWQELYERLMLRQSITPRELERMAYDYASRSQWQSLAHLHPLHRTLEDFLPPSLPQPLSTEKTALIRDPVMPSPDLQYTHQPLDPWTFLFQSAECIAFALSERLRETC